MYDYISLFTYYAIYSIKFIASPLELSVKKLNQEQSLYTSLSKKEQ